MSTAVSSHPRYFLCRQRYQRMLTAGLPVGVVVAAMQTDFQHEPHEAFEILANHMATKEFRPTAQYSTLQSVIEKVEELASGKYWRMEQDGYTKGQIARQKHFDVVRRTGGFNGGQPEDGLSQEEQEAFAAILQDVKHDPSTRFPVENAETSEDRVIGSAHTSVSSSVDTHMSEAQRRAKAMKLESIRLRNEIYRSRRREMLQRAKIMREHGSTLDEDDSEAPVGFGNVESGRDGPIIAPTYDPAPAPPTVRVLHLPSIGENCSPTARVHSEGRVYTVNNAVPASICDELVKLYQFTEDEEEYQRLEMVEQKRGGRVIMRTSLRRKFFHDELASHVWNVVQDVVPRELSDGRKVSGIRTQMNFYRYANGDFFDTHLDGGHRFLETGDTSEYTFVLYLNDDFEGGATQFCDIDEWSGARSVSAERGSLLVFRQRDCKHSGTTILSGHKYIVQGMVMYGPLSHHKHGPPIGKRPMDFQSAQCDC